MSPFGGEPVFEALSTSIYPDTKLVYMLAPSTKDLRWQHLSNMQDYV